MLNTIIKPQDPLLRGIGWLMLLNGLVHVLALPVSGFRDTRYGAVVRACCFGTLCSLSRVSSVSCSLSSDRCCRRDSRRASLRSCASSSTCRPAAGMVTRASSNMCEIDSQSRCSEVFRNHGIIYSVWETPVSAALFINRGSLPLLLKHAR